MGLVRANVAETAYLTAWVRALGRLQAGDAANGDHLATGFLRSYQRMLLRSPRMARWLLDRTSPGAYGYFNARTRCFDDRLLEATNARLEQLVLLGAGFDSRPQRFVEQLAGVRVFEVDMPEVLRRRKRGLARVQSSAETIAVPIDFAREELCTVLEAAGFQRGARSLFLWEGVTYYLPPEAVDGALHSIARCTEPGSTIVFDYVTQAFFEGDHSGYGASALARGWRRMGNVNLSGVADVVQLLKRHGFELRSELDAESLERTYLRGLPGSHVRSWGPMRIAHAVRI
jgi:methyltransferase (TIGR00027 family)